MWILYLVCEFSLAYLFSYFKKPSSYLLIKFRKKYTLPHVIWLVYKLSTRSLKTDILPPEVISVYSSLTTAVKNKENKIFGQFLSYSRGVTNAHRISMARAS